MAKLKEMQVIANERMVLAQDTAVKLCSLNSQVQELSVHSAGPLLQSLAATLDEKFNQYQKAFAKECNFKLVKGKAQSAEVVVPVDDAEDPIESLVLNVQNQLEAVHSVAETLGLVLGIDSSLLQSDPTAWRSQILTKAVRFVFKTSKHLLLIYMKIST